MPIRDILVDWDTTGRPRAGNNPGKYMNRKPSCQETEDKPIGACANDINVPCTVDNDCRDAGGGTCRNDRVTFGNSPDACDPGYYEFIGAYAFDESDGDKCGYSIGGRSPNGLAAADLTKLTRDYGLKPGHRYCAFKPKVIIIDNWGWCNGTCQQNTVFVEGNPHGVTHSGCWGSDDPEKQEENICTNNGLRDYAKAGTPFNGWIIVAEKK